MLDGGVAGGVVGQLPLASGDAPPGQVGIILIKPPPGPVVLPGSTGGVTHTAFTAPAGTLSSKIYPTGQLPSGSFSL